MSYGTIRRGQMAADVLGTHFTQVYNGLIRDPELTALDKAVFFVIASHRDGYGVSVESICAFMKEGRTAVKAALQRLEVRGFLVRSRTRTDANAFGPSVYEITDMPEGFAIAADKPYPDDDEPDGQASRSEPRVGIRPVDSRPVAEPPVDSRRPKKNSYENTSPPLRGGENAPTPACTREGSPSQAPPANGAPVEASGQTKIFTPDTPDLGKRARRSRKTPWPGLFDPAPELLAWAAKHYPTVDPEAETQAFNAYWDEPERAQAERDWAASWRTWINRAAKDGRTTRRRRPATMAEMAAVEPLVTRWWGWCADNGKVTVEREADLYGLLVEFHRTGVDNERLARALWACKQPTPPSWMMAKALRGEIAPPGPDGRPARRSTTDDRVAQVDDAVAAAKAELAASRAAANGRLALGGGA